MYLRNATKIKIQTIFKRIFCLYYVIPVLQLNLCGEIVFAQVKPSETIK
jgi:hypothetical protein